MEPPNDVTQLFLKARGLASSARREFLAQLDPHQRREVESLLEFDSPSDKTASFEVRVRSLFENISLSSIDLNQASPREPGQATPSTPQSRYPIAGTVGQGGMGVVLRAHDETLRRDVALKFLLESPELPPTSTPEGSARVSRFIEEAQITGQLEHPGIVPVHELDIDESGKAYFTMRLVRGETLGEVLRRMHEGEAAWSRTRVLNTILKVCETVAFAHDKGVIHRDLKPSNVMVGDFGEAYVMDWGLAKVLGEEGQAPIPVEETTSSSRIETNRTRGEDSHDTEPLQTMEGDVIGTPAYMAPEQARGEISAINERADVYALGALLYEFIKGERPYRSKGPNLDARMVHALVLTGPPDPLSSLQRRESPELIAICDKAMARDPNDRYANAARLADDVRAFLEDRVVQAHRTGALIELQKWVKRNKVAAASILAVLLLATGALTSINWITKQANVEILKAKKAVDERNEILEEQKTALQENAEVIRSQRDALSEEKKRVEEEAGKATSTLDILKVMLKTADPEALFGSDYTVVQLLDDFSGSFDDTGFQETPSVLADVHVTMGEAYLGLGEASKALSEFEKTLAYLKASEGESSVKYGVTLVKMVQAYDRLGRFDEGEEISRQSIEILKAHRGEESIDVAGAYAGLSMILCRQGSFQEAEEKALKAIEIGKRHYGDLHPEVSAPLMTLGSIYEATGRFDQGASVTREAYKIQEAFFGKVHIRTAAALSNLGILLNKSGDYVEAEQVLREALDIYQEVSGEDHWHYAGVVNNWGMTLQYTGRGDQAESAYRRAVKTGRELGTLNPILASSLNNLANYLSTKGEFVEAEALRRECLKAEEQMLGEESPMLALSLDHLAYMLAIRGEFREASLYLDRLEALGTPRFGAAVSTLIPRFQAERTPRELASLLRLLGRNQEAKALLERTIEGSPPSEDRLRLRLELAGVLTAMKSFEESEALLLEEMDVNQDDVSSMVLVIDELIELYRSWGKEDEAEEWQIERDDLEDGAADVGPSRVGG